MARNPDTTVVLPMPRDSGTFFRAERNLDIFA